MAISTGPSFFWTGKMSSVAILAQALACASAALWLGLCRLFLVATHILARAFDGQMVAGWTAGNTRHLNEAAAAGRMRAEWEKLQQQPAVAHAVAPAAPGVAPADDGQGAGRQGAPTHPDPPQNAAADRQHHHPDVQIPSTPAAAPSSTCSWRKA